MKLIDVPCGSAVRALAFSLAPALRVRLAVLGIYPGARLVLLARTPLRHTYLVGTEYACVVLARAVAEGIVCA